MTEDIIKQYLASIDARHEDDLAKGNTLEISVHQGYYATLVRYIEDNSSLTMEELQTILTLYSIDSIPEISGYRTLVLMPQPYIDLSGNKDKIAHIPQPMVMMVRTLQITSVPQVEMTIVLPLAFTYIPQPLLSVDFGQMLNYIPQPVAVLEGVTIRYDILNMPQPQILSADPGKLIMYIPQPNMLIEQANPAPNTVVYYMMVTAYGGEEEDRNMLIDEIVIDKMNQLSKTESVGDRLDIDFRSEEYGYMVFAVPAYAAVRTHYLDPLGFKGFIGGVADPRLNLFPDPIQKETGGTTYNLYVSNYRTIATKGTYQFYA